MRSEAGASARARTLVLRRLASAVLRLALALGAASPGALAAPAAEAPKVEAPLAHALKAAAGDYVIPNFSFVSGETLPELRLHYLTLGKVHRDAQGHVDNAILILHGSGSNGRSFLRERFAGVLFGKGQLLDAQRYYIILPDAIGHGDSSKPSDGLHAHFPHYDYTDMVVAQHALVTQGLNVDHLRLVMGAAMGGMHAFLWAERYGPAADAYMPLACLPVAIAGRNRVWRELLVQAIRSDRDWQDGEYKTEPLAALRTVAGLLLIADSAPLEMQHALPTREAADEFVDKYMHLQIDSLDANDTLYEFEASRSYDAGPGLDAISAPLMWINSADDFLNPPELGIAEREVKRIRSGRFVLLPASEETHGHGTSGWPLLWQGYLKQLLEASQPGAPKRALLDRP